jgi:UDPglucose 6-dehydrogenase
MMEIAVIGAGYVGLVQAAGLAHLGHRVRLGEVNGDRVRLLRDGTFPIFEPGLAELFEQGMLQGQISVHSDNLDAIDGAAVVFLTLPTPPGSDGRANLSFIDDVVDQIAPHLHPEAILVTKSTVPVGTAERIRKRLRDLGCGAGVVSNPEFLSEGNAVEDFLRAERIVVGAFEDEHGHVIADLYRGLPAKVVLTDPVSAELTKYAANAYLATRLTFANSISNLAEELGADALQVIEGVGLDRRIGHHFMRPGPGYGGSCFPKDTSAMLAMSRHIGYDFAILEAVVRTNDLQRSRIVDRCEQLLGGLDGRRIGVWGIAFKAGTDDVRDSPAVALADALAARGATVTMYDPEATVDRHPVAASALDAADGAELLLVATEWPVFQQVPADRVAERMAGDLVYDVRNLLDPATVRAAGLRYVGLGRPNT